MILVFNLFKKVKSDFSPGRIHSSFNKAITLEVFYLLNGKKKEKKRKIKSIGNILNYI